MSLGEKDSSEILGFLQEKGDYYTKLALIEKKRQSDLEDAILHISNETEKFRAKAKQAAIDVMNLHVLTPHPAYSRADGADIGRQAIQLTSKVLGVLEVKLNKLLQRKSEFMNRNKQLKTEIDHYRRMRMQTNVTHVQYEAVLKEQKEKIEAFVAESAAVVEDRERLVREKEALERINTEEQAVFIKDFELMGEFIKHQNTALEEALLRERKNDKTGTVVIEESNLTLDEEVDMARQVGSLTNFMETEQSSLSTIQERISSYELMFEQLKKMTGTSNLEEVISNYVAHEEEMFSLYNFIQTVNAEVDSVIEQKNQIELEIKIFKEEQQMQDNQRRSVIDELEHRLASTQEMTRLCEEQNKEMQDAVAQVSKKVSSLFFKLQCDQMETRGAQSGGAGAAGAVGGSKGLAGKGAGMSRPESKIALLMSQGVSEGNVLEYMGCIEQRAVDIISAYIRQQAHESNAPPGSHHTGNRSPTPGPSTPMVWPADPVVDVGEFSDDELMVDKEGDAEADSKPVDLSTFKEKLQRKLGMSSTFSSAGGTGGGPRPKNHHK